MAFESGIVAYDGVMSATVYEGPAFTTATPNNIVRTSQDWGVRVQWTMTGANRPLIEALSPTAEFRLFVFLERIGPGAGVPLPTPAAIENILGGAVVGADRNYTRDLQFPAGSVSDGTYHLTTMVQLYNGPAPVGTPQAAAGFIELPMVLFFTP